MALLHVHYTPVAIFEFRILRHRHSFSFFSAGEKINIKKCFLYRVYVKMVVSHVFLHTEKKHRRRFTSLTIGTRKNIHGFDRTKEIFPRERFSLHVVKHSRLEVTRTHKRLATILDEEFSFLARWSAILGTRMAAADYLRIQPTLFRHKTIFYRHPLNTMIPYHILVIYLDTFRFIDKRNDKRFNIKIALLKSRKDEKRKERFDMTYKRWWEARHF